MSVKEVIDLLNTQGIKLPNNFERESRWLRELRNNIEHYHFEMDLTRVESTIGRLIEDVMKISETHDLHLERYVGPEFMSLAQQHRVKLNAAIERIEKAKALSYLGCSPKDSLEIKFGIYNCDDCDNPTLVSSDGSVTGYLCEFCGGEESHEMEVTCANCKGCWPYGEMELWLMDHDESEMRCPMCTGAYAMSRDNS